MNGHIVTIPKITESRSCLLHVYDEYRTNYIQSFQFMYIYIWPLNFSMLQKFL